MNAANQQFIRDEAASFLGRELTEEEIEEAFSRYTIVRSLEIQAQRQAAAAATEKAAPFGDPTTPTLYRPDKQLVNPTAKPTRRRMTNEAINLEA